MTKLELTLSQGYVADWTYVEAIRELFQNALDSETINPENTMFFKYDEQSQTLQLGNKTSVLTPDTLLMGSSEKRDDDNTIGRHGEGYKVALMVLLREDKEVVIFNYGAKEIWTTRIKRSKKFGGEKLVELSVEKLTSSKRQSALKLEEPNNLVIEVKGVTIEEYDKLKTYNLHLSQYPNHIAVEGYGKILTDEEYKGKLFINGLYVQTMDKFAYGYDLNPDKLRLDRDRRLVDTYDLSLITSKAWARVEDTSLAADLIEMKAVDIMFLEAVMPRRSVERSSSIAVVLADRFKAKHGSSAIPVYSNEDLELVKRSGTDKKAVIVSKQVAQLIAPECESPEEALSVLSPKERIESWLSKVEWRLSSIEVGELKSILSDMD